MRRKVKKISFSGASENKKIRNAKKLEINGLKFRSKLEAFTYQKLVENGITDFKYEADKFVLQEAFEYNNESYEAYERKEGKQYVKNFSDVDHKIRSLTYLPDFTRINPATKTGWILEVKGYNNDAFPIKWKLFKKYLQDNNYDVTLYKPNTQGNVIKCVELIKSRYYR